MNGYFQAGDWVRRIGGLNGFTEGKSYVVRERGIDPFVVDDDGAERPAFRNLFERIDPPAEAAPQPEPPSTVPAQLRERAWSLRTQSAELDTQADALEYAAKIIEGGQ